MKPRFAALPNEPEWIYWVMPDGRPVARMLRSEWGRVIKGAA